ncbi:Histone deacetylase complex subunit, partial [Coemansia aciculifera]
QCFVKQSSYLSVHSLPNFGKSSNPLVLKSSGKNKRRRASYGEVYSPASYNDVLSAGIEDSTRAAQPAYSTATKQEQAETGNGVSNDGGEEPKDGGDSKRNEEQESEGGDSKQNGEQESEGGGAASEKSGDGSDNDDDEEDEGEEDDGVVRCVCGERNDGELMIQCEICQVWQHTLCMGIRDEAHIPDKYYCEKCHPEDHPYINSRPRTMVLAEATALGASTMMRRSAVMAVAKMTAREEYRTASAAAAIAASVAAAATGGKSAGGNSSRRSPAKKSAGGSSGVKKNDASQKSSRRTPRRNRKLPPASQQRGADANGVDGSEDDYDENRPGETPGTGGSGGSTDRADGDESLKSARRSSAANSPLTARKTQTPKRASQSNGGNGNKRRRVGDSAAGESAGTDNVAGEDPFASDL